VLYLIENLRKAYGGHVVAKLSWGPHRLMTPGTALIGDAQTLVLDEPTNILEPEMRRRVWTA